MTHYEVLGVRPGASSPEIRRAYLDLARRHHPDVHGDETMMQRINEAWQVLGNAERRRRYDDDLAARSGVRSAPQPPPKMTWSPRQGGAHPDFVPVDDGPDEGRIDPEMEDDTPIGRPVPSWQQILPVATLIAALATLSLGMAVKLRELLALGVILLVVAGVGFVLTPMLAVLRTSERNPER